MLDSREQDPNHESPLGINVELLERRMIQYYSRKVRQRFLRRLMMLAISVAVFAGLWYWVASALE